MLHLSHQHIAEELWEALGHTSDDLRGPVATVRSGIDEWRKTVVRCRPGVNGKVRGRYRGAARSREEALLAAAWPTRPSRRTSTQTDSPSRGGAGAAGQPGRVMVRLRHAARARRAHGVRLLTSPRTTRFYRTTFIRSVWARSSNRSQEYGLEKPSRLPSSGRSRARDTFQLIEDPAGGDAVLTAPFATSGCGRWRLTQRPAVSTN